MRRSIAIAGFCGLLLPLAGVPQKKAEPSQPPTRFETTTREVIVPVTVMYDRGQFVDNLEKNEFRIYDDGRPQVIRSFSHDRRQSTVIGFLVDQSNASRHWNRFKEAVKEMIWALLDEPKSYSGYLISFADTADLVGDTTSDADSLAEKIDRLQPGGGSALFAAIRRACTDRRLIPGEPVNPRRVIVVFGDGHDTASPDTLDQALELANRAQAIIFGVSTAAYGMDNPEKGQLERLAGGTGGRVLYPLNDPFADVPGTLSRPSEAGNYALPVGSGAYEAHIQKALFDAVRAVQGEITNQYILTFTPSRLDEKRHRLKVEIPSVPGLKIRPRPYYDPGAMR